MEQKYSLYFQTMLEHYLQAHGVCVEADDGNMIQETAGRLVDGYIKEREAGHCPCVALERVLSEHFPCEQETDVIY